MKHDFGAWLKYLRRERGLTLRELGALTGIDHAYIHRLETGSKTHPSPAILAALSKGLGRDVRTRQGLALLAKAEELRQEAETLLTAPDTPPQSR